MMQLLHDTTKSKINKMFRMTESFCETQLETYKNYPDVIFLVTAFSEAITTFNFKLKTNKTYPFDGYHNDIFELDNMMSAWKDNLTYNMPDSDSSNDLYTVLFSVLQAVDSLIDEDHFQWEAEAEPSEDVEEKDYIEKTF